MSDDLEPKLQKEDDTTKGALVGLELGTRKSPQELHFFPRPPQVRREWKEKEFRLRSLPMPQCQNA